ncbi:MAG: hypothetical protein DRP45_00035 [Candidatus Zixiibacteriota bacterium]|nr:MAG: hypothetical protein DRP45_00035 [candidate division Zixibacteria bacterium]
MKGLPVSHPGRFDYRLLSIIAVVLTVVVFAITWVSTRQSRASSFELLVAQGTAFTESLAQAADNAITAEAFYDELVEFRYHDLVTTLLERDIAGLSEQDWMTFALSHDLLGAYIFDGHTETVTGITVRGGDRGLPDFVEQEMGELIRAPESNYVLLLDESGIHGEMVHYYLEVTNQLDRVIALATDALYYGEALRQTGIGYLSQRMAREKGVEYIIYQSDEGIIFASCKPGNLLAIESDPFLTDAQDSDTIVSRIFEFQGKNVLELVRPFSSPQFKFGLFRVGLSLDGYYSVSRGFDHQMIIFSSVLFVLLIVALAYLRGRRKRWELMEKYEQQARRKERLSEMGNLAAGVAHEIRNPLNTISIAAQRLQAEFSPEQDHEQYNSFTKQIRSETTRLNDIITRFLALARQETTQRGEIRLDSLLTEIGDLLRVEGEKLELDVSIKCEPGLTVRADPNQLKQVFLNLFNNTKEALAGATGKFRVSAVRDGSKVVIAIADDGPGVPADSRDKLFAPYYTTKEAGTGLGLATIQKIVSDMDGDVQLDEQYANGARFVITLPKV